MSLVMGDCVTCEESPHKPGKALRAATQKYIGMLCEVKDYVE